MSTLAPSHPFPPQSPGRSDLLQVRAPPNHYYNPSAPEHTSFANAPIPKLTFHTTSPYFRRLMPRLDSQHLPPIPSSNESLGLTTSRHLQADHNKLAHQMICFTWPSLPARKLPQHRGGTTSNTLPLWLGVCGNSCWPKDPPPTRLLLRLLLQRLDGRIQLTTQHYSNLNPLTTNHTTLQQLQPHNHIPPPTLPDPHPSK